MSHSHILGHKDQGKCCFLICVGKGDSAFPWISAQPLLEPLLNMHTTSYMSVITYLDSPKRDLMTTGGQIPIEKHYRSLYAVYAVVHPQASQPCPTGKSRYIWRVSHQKLPVWGWKNWFLVFKTVQNLFFLKYCHIFGVKNRNHLLVWWMTSKNPPKTAQFCEGVQTSPYSGFTCGRA